MNFSSKKCKPCEGIGNLLSKKEIQENLKSLKNWNLKENRIEKEFKFKDFKSALEFVNKIGKISDQENHHPDIQLSWGKATISWHTHALNGLTINDFIMASKTDEIRI